jgi:GTP-binding protein
MNFVDEAVISVEAGAGGDGCAAFRREKNVPRGGPAGGDGGNGGSVIMIATSRISTLLDFRFKRVYKAERGHHGEGGDRYGRCGFPLEIQVPVGTVISNKETGEKLGDLIADGQTLVVAKGGHGGLGNIHFASSTNQTPTRCDHGTAGEAFMLKLELKLLADVGLLGFPNAGKSTFLASVTAARPKIADYPFTTLIPNLGVARLDDERAFVIADIPGLIEGASEGKGLGHRFLKHLERTRLLIHLVEYPIEGNERDPLEEVRIIEDELKAFEPELAALPRVLVMTKLDLCYDRSEIDLWKEKFGRELICISSATGEGVKNLLDVIWSKLPSGATEEE